MSYKKAIIQLNTSILFYEIFLQRSNNKRLIDDDNDIKGASPSLSTVIFGFDHEAAAA